MGGKTLSWNTKVYPVEVGSRVLAASSTIRLWFDQPGAGRLCYLPVIQGVHLNAHWKFLPSAGTKDGQNHVLPSDGSPL